MSTDDSNQSIGPGDPRVYLAAERTLLAWVRTGLAMMGFGFVVARFGLFLHELAAARGTAPPPRTGVSLWAGVAMVALGVWVCATAAYRHADFRRRFARNDPVLIRRSVGAVALAIALAAVGVAVAVHLLITGARV